jgi:hypothetical protein
MYEGSSLDRMMYDAACSVPLLHNKHSSSRASDAAAATPVGAKTVGAKTPAASACSALSAGKISSTVPLCAS